MAVVVNIANTHVASLAARAAWSLSLRALEAFFSFLLRSCSSFSIAARWSSCVRACRYLRMNGSHSMP